MRNVYVCVFMMCFVCFIGLNLLPTEVTGTEVTAAAPSVTDLGRGSFRRCINDDVRWCVLGGLNVCDHGFG